MPPKKKKKKKKGGDQPDKLKVQLRQFYIGEEGAPEPVPFEVAPNWSLAKAKSVADVAAFESALKLPQGSLVFATWTLKRTFPSWKDPKRQLRDVPRTQVYDFNWLVNMGVQAESTMLVHPPENGGRRYKVDWYIDIPDIPPFRKMPTPEELAALAAANKKSKKKKKKK